jgi:arabinose-5-phosphate isomerase
MSEQRYFSKVVEMLHHEANAIEQTVSRLDADEVERAVELLVNCEGKVVLSGIGKSGVIANKIAATMTSTGTAAIYVHPSDALHGSLGVITKGDVVIALSNSGETDELIAMLPALKRREVSIIAIVGKLNSTLARQATVTLDASVDEEACPLNLAPTTSTTVALAIGDALAMTTMQAKGWTTEDFAENHPAGRIGKRLTLHVEDLMHSGTNNPTIKSSAPLFEIISTITKGGLGAVNVIDDEGHLMGLVTDGDLRRAFGRSKQEDLANLNCETMMTRNPIVARKEMLAYDALRLMEDRPSQISVLPVVDENEKSIGLIRLHDIVRSGL